MTDPNGGPREQNALGAKYLAAVGGLLLVIVASLAALWLRERARRVRAESATASLRRQLRGAVLGRMLQGRLEAGGPVGPDEMEFVEATLDGQRLRAVRISAAAGRRLGFRPGDVIVIADAPSASSQATTRAER